MASGAIIGIVTVVGSMAMNYMSQSAEASRQSKVAGQAANSALTEGQYQQRASYRKAEVSRENAKIRLQQLKRNHNRSTHSLGSHVGVVQDSDSVMNSRSAMDYRAKIDEELILYDAKLETQGHVQRGDMALWRSKNRINGILRDYSYNADQAGRSRNKSLLMNMGNLGNQISNLNS